MTDIHEDDGESDLPIRQPLEELAAWTANVDILDEKFLRDIGQHIASAGSRLGLFQQFAAQQSTRRVARVTGIVDLLVTRIEESLQDAAIVQDPKALTALGNLLLTIAKEDKDLIERATKDSTLNQAVKEFIASLIGEDRREDKPDSKVPDDLRNMSPAARESLREAVKRLTKDGSSK